MLDRTALEKILADCWTPSGSIKLGAQKQAIGLRSSERYCDGVSRLANSPKNNHAALIEPLRQTSATASQPSVNTDDWAALLALPLLDSGEPIAE
jgi:hypothetical protein